MKSIYSKMGVCAGLLLLSLTSCLVLRFGARSVDSAGDDLIGAIENGDDARAFELIHRGVGNSRYYFPGESGEWCFPIHMAALKGRDRILASLVKKFQNPDIRDYRGHTPLMYLANGCDMQRAYDYEKSLVVLTKAEVDFNAETNSHDSVLHMTHCPSFLVASILKGGANPNRKNVDGDTPLHTACQSVRLSSNGSSCDAVPILLVYGADPTIVNAKGLTPMQVAVNEGRDDIVSVLLQFKKLLNETSVIK